MASLTARAVSFVLLKTGTFKKLFSGGPDLEQRLIAIHAKPIAEPTKAMHRKLDVRREEFEGRAVWHIGPKTGATDVRVLYFHGGGYVYTAASAHWAFIAHMVAKHGLSFIVPLYPLAPEADARGYTRFALALYRDLLGKHDAARIVVGGDSAGGGLALNTVRLASEAALAQPAGLILICPWLDVTASQPEQLEIEKRDAILTIGGIRDIGPILARDLALDDPLVSPIHAKLQGLPPTLMYGGGDDILVTDARRFKAEHADVDYREGAGLIHVWPIFFFPESRKAQAEMAAFVKRVTA
jgi:epsilon-lactone hydrolase